MKKKPQAQSLKPTSLPIMTQPGVEHGGSMSSFPAFQYTEDADGEMLREEDLLMQQVPATLAHLGELTPTDADGWDDGSPEVNGIDGWGTIGDGELDFDGDSGMGIFGAPPVPQVEPQQPHLVPMSTVKPDPMLTGSGIVDPVHVEPLTAKPMKRAKPKAVPPIQTKSVKQEQAKAGGSPYELLISGVPPRYRADKQFRMCIQIVDWGTTNLVTRYSSLVLPREMMARSAEVRPSSSNDDTALFLEVEVVTASDERPVVRCFSCCQREKRNDERVQKKRKSAPKKPLKPLSVEEEQKRVLLLYSKVQDMDFSGGELIIPVRATCYCSHHGERTGFQIHVTLRNNHQEVVANALSSAIFVTDDHRNKSAGAGAGAGASAGATRPKKRVRKQSRGTDEDDDEDEDGDEVGVGGGIGGSSRAGGFGGKSTSLSLRTGSSSLGIRSVSVSASASVSDLGDGDSDATAEAVRSPGIPELVKIAPGRGPTAGGIEVVIMGQHFSRLMSSRFGLSDAATTFFNNTTLVAIAPPSALAITVPVTIQGPALAGGIGAGIGQVAAVETKGTLEFTYEDSRRDMELMELALQVIGLKLTGRLEDALSIAHQIVQETQEQEQRQGNQNGSGSGQQQSILRHAIDLVRDCPSDVDEWLKKRLASNSDSNASDDAAGADLLSSIVMLLKSIGPVDLSVQHPKTGRTLLHIAATRSGAGAGAASYIKQLFDMSLAKQQQAYNVVDLLSIRDACGYNPVHTAALHGSMSCLADMMRPLLTVTSIADANLNSAVNRLLITATDVGQTPLYLAVMAKSMECVEFLLELEVELESTHGQGMKMSSAAHVPGDDGVLPADLARTLGDDGMGDVIQTHSDEYVSESDSESDVGLRPAEAESFFDVSDEDEVAEGDRGASRAQDAVKPLVPPHVHVLSRDEGEDADEGERSSASMNASSASITAGASGEEPPAFRRSRRNTGHAASAAELTGHKKLPPAATVPPVPSLAHSVSRSTQLLPITPVPAPGSATLSSDCGSGSEADLDDVPPLEGPVPASDDTPASISAVQKHARVVSERSCSPGPLTDDVAIDMGDWAAKQDSENEKDWELLDLKQQSKLAASDGAATSSTSVAVAASASAPMKGKAGMMSRSFKASVPQLVVKTFPNYSIMGLAVKYWFMFFALLAVASYGARYVTASPGRLTSSSGVPMVAAKRGDAGAESGVVQTHSHDAAAGNGNVEASKVPGKEKEKEMTVDSLSSFDGSGSGTGAGAGTDLEVSVVDAEVENVKHKETQKQKTDATYSDSGATAAADAAVDPQSHPTKRGRGRERPEPRPRRDKGGHGPPSGPGPGPKHGPSGRDHGPPDVDHGRGQGLDRGRGRSDGVDADADAVVMVSRSGNPWRYGFIGVWGGALALFAVGVLGKVKEAISGVNPSVNSATVARRRSQKRLPVGRFDPDRHPKAMLVAYLLFFVVACGVGGAVFWFMQEWY